MYFMIAATIIAVIVMVFMPKRLTAQEIYGTWIFMALVTRTCDQYLDQVLNLYDQLPQYNVDGTNWIAITLQNIFPASTGVIILNFMPKSRVYFGVYMVGVTFCSVVFEWVCIYVGYLVYYHWSLGYSMLVYLIGTLMLRYHLSFLRGKLTE